LSQIRQLDEHLLTYVFNYYRLLMDPCAAGALRLAAARNDICTLQLLADGADKFHVDADFEGFTALHAAAVQGSAGMLGRRWLLYLSCLSLCKPEVATWHAQLGSLESNNCNSCMQSAQSFEHICCCHEDHELSCTSKDGKCGLEALAASISFLE
jgi:hypothetical protein